MEITVLMNENLPQENFRYILNTLITSIYGNKSSQNIDILCKKPSAEAIIETLKFFKKTRTAPENIDEVTIAASAELSVHAKEG